MVIVIWDRPGCTVGHRLRSLGPRNNAPAIRPDGGDRSDHYSPGWAV